MKKTNKIINIALISLLIEVGLCQGFVYAKDFSLRVPLKTKNPGLTGPEMSHLEIRARYEDLRKRFGSKAAWLIILQELGLPEKLGFKIPQFVCFEQKEAKAIYDKYTSEKIEDIIERFDREFRIFRTEYSLMELYRSDFSDEEFEQKVNLLFNEKLTPLLDHASKKDWIDFFISLRQSPRLKRWVNNAKQEYPYPEYNIDRDMVIYLGQAIRLLNAW